MRPSRFEEGTRAGAALVFVVLLLLALVGLGHGMLASALGELAASRAAVRQLLGRAAAEAAVARALRQSGGLWTDSVRVGGVRTVASVELGRAEAVASVRRLAPESWLVEGIGRVAGRATARSARLAWSVDPLTRVTALEGALNVGAGASVTLSGPVDVSGPTRADPPLGSGDCAAWIADLERHYASAPLAAIGALVDTTGGPALGLLEFPSLLAAADVVVGGAGTPGPVERLRVCARDEPWSWGDPEQPREPCGTHFALRASTGDLTVLGGVGQGVLVVDGDLTLTAGARFYGLLIVGGELRVEDGASVEGLVLARGGAVVASDGRVRGSACWAVRVLSAQGAALGRLLPVPGVGAIGPR